PRRNPPPARPTAARRSEPGAAHAPGGYPGRPRRPGPVGGGIVQTARLPLLPPAPHRSVWQQARNLTPAALPRTPLARAARSPGIRRGATTRLSSIRFDGSQFRLCTWDDFGFPSGVGIRVAVALVFRSRAANERPHSPSLPT